MNTREDILEPRYLISILNLLTLALLTVNLPISTRPTVLYTKKGYGMIIFVPIKKEEMTPYDVMTGNV
jgi:hypothetical protein